MPKSKRDSWFYYFVLLPCRWFIKRRSWWSARQQTCKVCGARDKFNFDVPDDLWKRTVPGKYQKHVVCLACFDDFAKERGISYALSIGSFCFAGDQETFGLEVKGHV